MISRLRRDESGAIAVIVTVMATLLLAAAAFAVDLANAFAVKRQLSVAADASAIAAAQDVSRQIPADAASAGWTCDPVALEAIATAPATTQNSLAQPDATIDSVTVDCADFPTDVTVTVVNRRDVPTFFGQFAGQAGFSPANTATARVFVPDTAVGLRPIAACLSDVQAAQVGTIDTPFVVIIQKDAGICATAATGEWAWTNFLDQGEFGEWNQSTSPIFFPNETCAGTASPGGGAVGCQSKWLESGYAGPVRIPNRTEQGTDPGNGAGADVRPPPGVTNGGGIAGANGNPSSVDDEVAGLVGDTIDLPVATRYWQAPDKRIDVVGAVTVTVCSAKVGKDAGDTILGPAPSACGTSEPTAANGGATAVANWALSNNNEAVLWVKPTVFTASGVVGDAISSCLGNSACDFGRRAVQLFQ